MTQELSHWPTCVSWSGDCVSTVRYADGIQQTHHFVRLALFVRLRGRPRCICAPSLCKEGRR